MGITTTSTTTTTATATTPTTITTNPKTTLFRGPLVTNDFVTTTLVATSADSEASHNAVIAGGVAIGITVLIVAFAVACLVHCSRTNTADATETKKQRPDSVTVPAISPGVEFFFNDYEKEIHRTERTHSNAACLGESLKNLEYFQRDQQDPSSKEKHPAENIQRYSSEYISV